MTLLARLSFWAPAQRMDEFEALYEKRLVPLLKKHDLVEGCESDRAGVEGIFSRLFELASPAEVSAREQALYKDSAWQEELQDLGNRFGTTFAAIHAGVDTYHYGYFTDGMFAEMAELIHYQFGPYSAPAGAGRVVEAGAGFRDGAWQALSVADGLPDSVVQGILEDREGCLWFATRGGGVCRYDGAEFTSFAEEDGLAGNDVPALLEDREGNVWFGTHRGACCYDGTEFINHTIEDGLAGNWVSSMLEDREGNVWFGTFGGGVSRYDGREFKTFTTEDGLAENNIRSILQDRQGNMWFGTRESGVSRFDGKCFSTLTTANGLLHNRVNAMLEDREGHLWFGTGSWEEGGGGGGVSRYDGQTFVHFTTADGLGHNEVWSILEDRQGDLWFGMLSGGVSRYDGQGFEKFTTEDGLANDRVTCVVEDRAGRVWIGTWGGGVSRYAELELQSVTTPDGLSRDAYTYLLTDRQGYVWIGSRKGAYRYDGEQLHPLDVLKDLHFHPFLEDRAGNLWLITEEEGVSRYDGREFTRFTTGDDLAHFWVICAVEDRQGRIWFGTNEGGVSRYDGREFKTFTTADGLGENRVLCAIEDREGYLWFGTDGGGVSRFDGREFKTFTTADGLVHNKVNCMLEDREGYLWFGTDGGGVSCFDGHEFKSFTTRDGLIHNRIISVMEDREGCLWFGSMGGGLSRYDGRVFQRLTRQDGLANDGVRQMVQDRQGDVWIATAGGLNRYRPQRTPPTLRLKDVIADRRYGLVEELQLTGSQRILTFEFQGVSWTTRPDGMAYVYRLEGFDADWQTTYERRAIYQDLELGHYTFQVKAVDRDLNYSEPAVVEVNVLPNIYIEALNEALSASGASGEFVGKSQALIRVQEQLAEVAPTGVSVFISGETGTGKGLAARTVHGLSSNKGGPFIQVNCGAIPDSLVESELFGHERGAFTGAVARKLGKVELASGGTLFLDEIGDLPLEAQVKILRFLDEHAFERLGGTQTIKPDVRIVTATNRDLLQMVAASRFREDLYFRLQVFPVRLPPLRERIADIPLLAAYFMERMAAHLHKEVNHLTPEALTVLQAYEWPGNVRELEHTLQRAVIVCQGPAIQARDIPLLGKAEAEAVDHPVTLDAFERRYIRQVLEQNRWIIGGPNGAAAILGLNESTLRGRMRKLGIKRP